MHADDDVVLLLVNFVGLAPPHRGYKPVPPRQLASGASTLGNRRRLAVPDGILRQPTGDAVPTTQNAHWQCLLPAGVIVENLQLSVAALRALAAIAPEPSSELRARLRWST